ncbi:MAG: DedA family protein [Thermodesulfobacteriota bacterium]|nr:DedA family protein [Thermodesulfobacteriota bacterium]
MPDSVIFLINYSEHFIYAGFFLILFLCGLGLPIPEEITLLAGGFLIYQGSIRFYPTLATLFVGVITGDMAMYSIGRKWGQGIITHRHMRKIFSESRLERAKQFFRDHGSKTIFIARFISGFRVAAFLAAGTMGMKPGKFLFLDTLAALIMVPLLILLGYFFGANIGWLTELFTRIDFLLKAGAVLGVVAALAYWLWKRKKSAARQ